MIEFLAIMGTIAVLATFFFAHRREVQTEKTYPPLGDILEVNGKRVHALVMGEGPDLVLIHGSSGNLRDYTTSIASELANSYRVILFDRPGLGHSERTTNMGDTLKDQALLLRDASLMLGAERPIVLGHSYGGSVALAWALEAPDNIAALVNVSGVSHPWTTGLDIYYKVTSHPYFGWVGALFISAFAPERSIQTSLKEVFAPQSPPKKYRQEFGVELVLRQKTILANARQRRILKSQIIAQAPRYTALTLPIEIIHGTEDNVVSPELHAKALERDAQNAHLSLLEGVGHMPHHVAQQTVIDAIKRAAERSGLRQVRKECIVKT